MILRQVAEMPLLTAGAETETMAEMPLLTADTETVDVEMAVRSKNEVDSGRGGLTMARR